MTGETPVRIGRSPRALWRRVGAEMVVMSPADRAVHQLSGGASAAWSEMEQPASVPELVDRLAEIHGVPSSEIAGQVQGCVDTLLSLGVAEVVDA